MSVIQRSSSDFEVPETLEELVCCVRRRRLCQGVRLKRNSFLRRLRGITYSSADEAFSHMLVYAVIDCEELRQRADAIHSSAQCVKELDRYYVRIGALYEKTL